MITNKRQSKVDGLVKSRNIHNLVIPVKTGIQSLQVVSRLWIPAGVYPALDAVRE